MSAHRPPHILVARSIKEALASKRAAAAAGWAVGAPLDPQTKTGPLIEPSALKRVLRYIDEAGRAGATIAFGGRRMHEKTGGWFVEPTIVDGVTLETAIAREEIFGPVAAVLPFDDEAEAAALANASDYGLAATVFSRDIDVAIRMARGVRAGTVAVNGYGEGDITTPFGGYKTSGFGGYDKGVEAFDQYTALKTIWVSIDA